MTSEAAEDKYPPSEYQLIIHGLTVTLIGFPRELSKDVRMERHELSNINIGELESSIAKELALKPARLTGTEAAFLVHFLDIDQAAYATMFDLSATEIERWLNEGNCPSPAHEGILRLRAFEYRFAGVETQLNEMTAMFSAPKVATKEPHTLRFVTPAPDEYEST